MRSKRIIFVLAFCLFHIGLLKKPDHSWSKFSRDFFNSYFGVIKGKEFSLDIDCFSGNFEKMSEDLTKAMSAGDFVKIVFDINQMINLEVTKCPLEEFRAIWHDFETASKNGTLFKNLFKNAALIEQNLKQFIESDKSACEMGRTIGSIMKIATYGVGYTSWEDGHDSHNEEAVKFLQ